MTDSENDSDPVEDTLLPSPERDIQPRKETRVKRILPLALAVLLFALFLYAYGPCNLRRNGCVKPMSFFQVLAFPTKENVMAFLTGNTVKRPRPTYPSSIGEKFHKDGRPRDNPGNTVICHVKSNSEEYGTLKGIQEDLKKQSFSYAFSYLPPHSFHMTVADGLIASSRKQQAWSSYVPENATMKEATDIFMGRLEGFKAFRTIRVRPVTVMGGISVKIEGVDKENDWKLWQARNALLARLGIKSGEYGFHISLAYQTRWLNMSMANAVYRHSQKFNSMLSKMEIELGPPEFCEFQTMHNFEIVKLLG